MASPGTLQQIARKSGRRLLSREKGKASDWNAKELMNSASWQRSSSPVFSSRRLWPFSASASALSQLPWCLRRWWVFPQSDQGFCTKPASVHGTREVWYWNDSCHKVIKVNRERCSFQGWDKFGIKCTWYSNLWKCCVRREIFKKMAYDFYAAREKMSSLWACATAERNLEYLDVDCFAMCPLGMRIVIGLGKISACSAQASVVSVAFGENSHVPTMHCTFINLVQMQLCQVKLCHEIFLGDLHNTSKILNKGTVALDPKKTAWLLLSRLDRSLGYKPLLHSPPGNMCFRGLCHWNQPATFHVTSTILLEHHEPKKNHRDWDSANYNDVSNSISKNQPPFWWYALIYCMPCVSPLKRPQKTQEIPKSSQSRRKLFHPKPVIPSWTHLVNPASAVQGFCFCPEKLIFDTMDFVQKNTAQIPQIQHSMCKVVNQMEKTYIFIPIYLSKAGKSFMIDSWSFCEEIYQCFCISTSEKGTEMTVMSLERKNNTQQLWKCSDLIWWWTSSLPLFKGWTSCVLTLCTSKAENLPNFPIRSCCLICFVSWVFISQFSGGFKPPRRNNARNCTGWVPTNKCVAQLPSVNIWQLLA